MSTPPFRRVLVANRGEIAVRVMRACAELGIETVAVYSEADRDALHVRIADEAICIGPPLAADSYLNIGAIIAAALTTRSEAIHPGYGFLSENADFAQACRDAGIMFVGPSPDAIRVMGNKIAAKRLAASLDIPLLPGYDGASQDPEALEAEANRISFPLLIKASAGGGGRGMRIVRQVADFRDALESATREAIAAFSDGTILLERYVDRPRHVEIQVFGDNHGSVIHLGERECSIQRRHQKVIEESPSPAVTPALRAAMGEAAVRLARAIGYGGAGTVEFLLDADGSFAFLEMNTRLQVEHGVTELVTGLDLVHLQLWVAAGEPLHLRQEDVRFRGHAIECRIYAEDPAAGFLPSTGKLTRFAPPEGPGIRNDIGVRTGDLVTPFYDPLLAKLLVTGATRSDSVDRMAQALRHYQIDGVASNLSALIAVTSDPAFRAGDTNTSFLDDHLLPSLMPADAPPAVLAAAAVALIHTPHTDSFHNGWRPLGGMRMMRMAYGSATTQLSLRRTAPDRWQVSGSDVNLAAAFDADAGRVRVIDDENQTTFRVSRIGDSIEVGHDAELWRIRLEPPLDVEHSGQGGAATGSGTLTAPLTGVVIKVHVGEGDTVRAQQPLIVLEAMKMEHTIAAPGDGTIARIRVAPGDHVQSGAVLVEMGGAEPS
jgi:3-methylcrotonyl-CoA carboxylase alpha subunit